MVMPAALHWSSCEGIWSAVVMRGRRIALDVGTVKALEEQRTRAENRAEICEAQLFGDAYVFFRVPSPDFAGG